jgi:hypothetical protein
VSYNYAKPVVEYGITYDRKGRARVILCIYISYSFIPYLTFDNSANLIYKMNFVVIF